MQSLRMNESDMMLAGGISLISSSKKGYWYQPGNILSADGYCRPYDQAATGTVPSSGAGVVALKRLSDAIQDRNTIYAVIKGAAVNNDGRLKASFTAPSKIGQVQCVQSAIADAGIEASSVSILEGHGSGTKLGDALELEALNSIYQHCSISSVKANIGHTDAASGIAGFIKTCLVLKNKILPGAIHFECFSDLSSKKTHFLSIFPIKI